jgi:hypothetical protein
MREVFLQKGISRRWKRTNKDWSGSWAERGSANRSKNQIASWLKLPPTVQNQGVTAHQAPALP